MANIINQGLRRSNMSDEAFISSVVFALPDSHK